MAEALRQIEAILAGLDAGMQPVSFQVDLICYEVLRAIDDKRAPVVLEAAHTRLQARSHHPRRSNPAHVFGERALAS